MLKNIFTFLKRNISINLHQLLLCYRTKIAGKKGKGKVLFLISSSLVVFGKAFFLCRPSLFSSILTESVSVRTSPSGLWYFLFSSGGPHRSYSPTLAGFLSLFFFLSFFFCKVTRPSTGIVLFIPLTSLRANLLFLFFFFFSLQWLTVYYTRGEGLGRLVWPTAWIQNPNFFFIF